MSLSIERNLVPSEATSRSTSSYLEWGAIFGGAVLAAAISTIMTTFGSAIGLSLVSPVSGHSTSLLILGIVFALWSLWITISSFTAGGYLAGRMRRPVGDVRSHESDIRDGTHGLVVWAVGALALTLVASLTVFGTSSTVLKTATLATSISQPVDPLTLTLDGLTRSTNASSGNVTPETRQELSRIFLNALNTGTLNDGDRGYVASKISAMSGIPQDEAQKRVDTAMTQLTQIKAEAQKKAEQARRIGILTAFLTAAVLLVGAAASWWGAIMGGKHRDEGMDLSHLIRRR